MRYEIELELRRDDEGEALAIARELAKSHAVVVNVYEVTQGRTFGDADERRIVGTVEP